MNKRLLTGILGLALMVSSIGLLTFESIERANEGIFTSQNEEENEKVAVKEKMAEGDDSAKNVKIVTVVVKKKIPVEFNEKVRVKSGDTVRLIHAKTGASLHSHRIRAPLTSDDFEVSGYGQIEGQNFIDPNDVWMVEFVNGNGGQDLEALNRGFRLKHVQTGCYLCSRNKALPEWGFKHEAGEGVVE
jgi:plastocyanin